jgi:hypothetical protein
VTSQPERSCDSSGATSHTSSTCRRSRQRGERNRASLLRSVCTGRASTRVGTSPGNTSHRSFSSTVPPVSRSTSRIRRQTTRPATNFTSSGRLGASSQRGLSFDAYDYRQLTGVSGAGALIGPLKGSVDAIGSASVIRRSLTRPRSSSTCANITNSMPKTGGRAMRR